MLARRLLLLIAVLLVVGAFASAIAPRDTTSGDRATTTPTTVTPPTGGALPQQGAGTTVTAVLPGRPEGATKRACAVGDLIDLTVKAPAPDSVTIAGYDEVQPADPENPAHFSFFADEPGTFDVTLQDAGTLVGRLEIGRRA